MPPAPAQKSTTISRRFRRHQLLCYLLAPKRREMVVDFCAGAGGKTLALGALMQSAGRLYAFDVSEARLNKLTPRLRRSQLSNVSPQLLDSENDARVRTARAQNRPRAGRCAVQRLRHAAPQSRPQMAAERAGHRGTTVKQRAILAAASTLVKPGGRLVYATCSFLRMENRDIVADFLASHPSFKLLPAAAILRSSTSTLDTGEFLELSPQQHGCDGFFAAAMERNPL